MVTDPAERRPLIEAAANAGVGTDVDEMVQHSPLIVLTVPDADKRENVPSSARELTREMI